MRNTRQSMMISILMTTGFPGLRFLDKEDRDIQSEAFYTGAQGPASSHSSVNVRTYKQQGAINGNRNKM